MGYIRVRIIESELKKIGTLNLDEFIRWDMKEEGTLIPERVFIADREMMHSPILHSIHRI